MAMDANVTVVGAGIGGLAVGLAFLLRGASVQVLEQAAVISEVGAGLQISPNGMRVLEALGVAERLIAMSRLGRGVHLRDYAQGRSVLRLDLMQLPADQQYYFVHRADLINCLEEAFRAAGGQVRLGARVEKAEGAQLYLQNGDRIQADLLVGADGVNSVLRRRVNGADEPFFTGQVAWRAIVPVAGLLDEAQVHMGPGQHVVLYPLRDGQSANLVAVEERSDWVAASWSQTGDAADLRQRFARFGALRDVLTRVEDVSVWGLFRHPVAARWHSENIALLGDAAHPTLPFLAQGANLALEDACCLAACLAGGAAREAGLRRYQALRRDRAVRVIKAANGNAWKYHLRNPLLRSAAHLGLRLAGGIAPGRMLGQFDWLYGYDVTKVN